MKRREKIRLVILLMIGLSIVGGIFFKNGIFATKVVGDSSVLDTLNNMGENRFFNILIKSRIYEIDVEKAQVLLREKRAQIEAKRLLEEQKKLEEKLKDPNAKYAYLTFDDGPSPKATPEILKILRDYNIKATFFVVGTMVEKYPEVLKQVYDEGHVIGNHSYSHNYKYLYKNTKNFMDDIRRNDMAIKKVLGDDLEINLLRFPGGSTGKYKRPMVKAAEKEGYSIYDWNSLNGDAEGLNLKDSYLTSRLRETTRNKRNIIVLMHDLDTKQGTVNTLSANIDYLISKGYIFRVLQEKEN